MPTYEGLRLKLLKYWRVSYLNQLVVQTQQLPEVSEILDTIDISEMISCKRIAFIMKMIYLRMKCNKSK